MENLVGQEYDEGGSWGRLSEGWLETSIQAEDKWVFLNKLNGGVQPVPYGSYVLVNSDTDTPILRIGSQAYFDALEEMFTAAGAPTKEQIMKRYDASVKATSGSSDWSTLSPWW